MDRVRRSAWGLAVAALGWCAASLVLGDDHVPAVASGGTGPGVPASAAKAADPWLAAFESDPMELAALAAREGDDAVLARLTPGVDPAASLIAVRATPFLRSPELALLPLAVLAADRDPDLAEAAARRARQIAQALALEGLALRELDIQGLVPARSALAQVAGRPQLRADLALLCSEAAQLLAAAGVPVTQPHAR